jgi:hypothetical protein
MKQPPANDYFKQRAEEERAASERATDERAARPHRELADEYLKRAAMRQVPPEEPVVGTMFKEFRIFR